jgi:hypothetical protein
MFYLIKYIGVLMFYGKRVYAPLFADFCGFGVAQAEKVLTEHFLPKTPIPSKFRRTLEQNLCNPHESSLFLF